MNEWPVIPIVTDVDASAFAKDYAYWKNANLNFVLQEWTDRLGGDSDLAMDLIKQWVDGPYESPLRWAVTSLIGGNPKHELLRIKQRARAHWRNDQEGMEASFSRMEENLHIGTSAKTLHTVRALATLTQLATADDRVKLVRGVQGAQAEDIYASAMLDGHAIISVDHATSFTKSSVVAEMFAFDSIRSGYRFGVVLEVNMPRHSIVASPKLCYALTGESEYIVATSGKFKVDRKEILVVD